MNSRKRDKPYFSRHAPYSFPKRRRPLPASTDDTVDASSNTASKKEPKTVVVIGLPIECSVLDLKSRFEIYGPISRTRMEPNGVAYITFRSNDAAQSAVDAARDPDFPISLHSALVQVMWASDPVPQWREGVERKEGISSKLVRAQAPLSRHGRGNKLGSAIVNPREENVDSAKSKDNEDNNVVVGNSRSDGAFNGREIVAYDDIL
ncbi:unnamed protein product [Fraxinus pennsylvanica]|uniref:RRM domain-containing protein n=1 Tax=Fraxinus pennsylvanica TaxID=56036 RepID=A0AAD1ZEH7_9LAMI|nr:unnamed protein product [Fraxinus pennsylvanica]